MVAVKTCECEVCKYGKLVWKNLDGMTPEQREFFEDMYLRLCHVENDVAYYKSILDGNWPNARGILQHALTKCPE